MPAGALKRTLVDLFLVKAVARAHRRKRPLGRGCYTSLGEIVAAEAVNRDYLARLRRLTLLAPERNEAGLDGRLTTELSLSVLLSSPPSVWAEQRVSAAGSAAASSRTGSLSAMPWRAGVQSHPHDSTGRQVDVAPPE